MNVGDELTVESVVEEARENTGLAEFGDEHFREPLRLLLDGFGRLSSPIQALVGRATMVHLVENRLRLHDVLTRRPEIRERSLRRPLFVMGLPRTGTTFLYRLLAEAPEARPLLLYESLDPVPRGEDDPAGRIARTEELTELARRLVPGLGRAHGLEATAPEEDVGLLQNTFVTPFMNAGLGSGNLQYRAWLQSLGPEARDRSYREYREQLQVLTGEDERRWVLKSPFHLYGLDALLRIFPDAAVVHTHRSVVQALPSLCSLRSMVQGAADDGGSVDRERIGAETTRFVEQLLDWSMRAREGPNADRIHDVRFEDLVGDPVETVRRIHDRFDYAFDRDLAGRIEGRASRREPSEHEYTAEEYGLDPAEIRSAFRWYHDRFDVAAPTAAADAG